MSSTIDGVECSHTGCDLVSVKQAAHDLGVNMQTVYRWIWSGNMPVVRRGHRILVKSSWLRDYKAGEIAFEWGKK